MTTWLDPGRCGQCKFCAMDMDMEPFCLNKKLPQQYHAFGLYINPARNIYCKGDWFEIDENRR